MTVHLPPIRRLFRPDPGMVLVDADLARADAQVVAWEAGDEALKLIFRQGLDLHTENANAIWGPGSARRACPWSSGTYRDVAKNCVHMVNFVGGAKTLSDKYIHNMARAEEFIRDWFTLHQAIHRWHVRVNMDLHTRREVRNQWGFRRHYFDRPEGLLPQAIAWIAQSTVGITINKGMVRLRHMVPEAQLLLQVHDSLLMQVPVATVPHIFPRIIDALEVTIPFPDPLVIPVGIKYSERSWGDVHAWDRPAD